MLEKRNVEEPDRTPCKRDAGLDCTCPKCSSKHVKKGDGAEVKGFDDLNGMAELHNEHKHK